MYYLVVSQTVGLRKSDFAYFTLEWSFFTISVTTVMSVKVPHVSKSLITLITNKGLFTGMDPMVL